MVEELIGNEQVMMAIARAQGKEYHPTLDQWAKDNGIDLQPEDEDTQSTDPSPSNEDDDDDEDTDYHRYLKYMESLSTTTTTPNKEW